MSPGTQNMKTGAVAPGIAENESGRAKHKNGTDTLGTTENETVRSKHENVTRCPHNHEK
jgi:hypothetical protein